MALVFAGAAAAVALLPVRRPWLVLGGLGTGLIGVALLRGLVILLARPLLPDQGLDISPWWLLLTLLPAALVLPRRGVALLPAEDPAERRWARPLAAAVAGIALTFWLGWDDPGAAKSGRIVFDDSHGTWEPTDVAFDTKGFGRRYSYTYGNFYDLLSWHYDVRRHREGPITAAVLKDADVLIVKTPVKPILPEEIQAIERFVSDGGGLFLIGDHTNLFGMTTFINALAGRFGLAFRADDTFDLGTESLTRWQRPLWLPHPIAALVPSFQFETSATIVAPLDARAVMVGYGMGAEPADFNNPGFFGNIRMDQREEDFGFFLQHVVLDHGRGRVAALSDSTPFSNFSIFFPGRRELALATVEWLNHEATIWRHVPLVAGALALLCLIRLLFAHRRRDAVVVVAALIAGLGIGSAILIHVAHALTLPQPIHDVRTVVFDLELSKAEFPPALALDPKYQLAGYDTFFVASQRLGYMPVMSDDLKRSLETADVLLLVDPGRSFTAAERQAVLRFVAAGGGLLVVDGLADKGAGTTSILEPFGLSIGQTALPCPGRARHPGSERRRARLLPSLAVRRRGLPGAHRPGWQSDLLGGRVRRGAGGRARRGGGGEPRRARESLLRQPDRSATGGVPHDVRDLAERDGRARGAMSPPVGRAELAASIGATARATRPAWGVADPLRAPAVAGRRNSPCAAHPRGGYARVGGVSTRCDRFGSGADRDRRRARRRAGQRAGAAARVRSDHRRRPQGRAGGVRPPGDPTQLLGDVVWSMSRRDAGARPPAGGARGRAVRGRRGVRRPHRQAARRPFLSRTRARAP